MIWVTIPRNSTGWPRAASWFVRSWTSATRFRTCGPASAARDARHSSPATSASLPTKAKYLVSLGYVSHAENRYDSCIARSGLGRWFQRKFGHRNSLFHGGHALLMNDVEPLEPSPMPHVKIT